MSNVNREGVENVINFISEFTKIKKEKIKENSCILFDLGVAGDDGEDLIIAFSREFSVDISEFDCESHFGKEGIFSSLRKRDQKNIKVSDLVNAAMSGRLKNK